MIPWCTRYLWIVRNMQRLQTRKQARRIRTKKQADTSSTGKYGGEGKCQREVWGSRLRHEAENGRTSTYHGRAWYRKNAVSKLPKETEVPKPPKLGVRNRGYEAQQTHLGKRAIPAGASREGQEKTRKKTQGGKEGASTRTGRKGESTSKTVHGGAANMRLYF